MRTGICLLFLLLFSCDHYRAMAQAGEDADALFAAARKAAFDESDRAKALMLCQKALNRSPNYADIIVFVGRLHTWNKMPDSARYYFERAIAAKPEGEDAYVAYADLEYWNDNNDKALELIGKGLFYHPTSSELLLRKAKVMNAMKNYRGASLVVDTLLRLDRSNTEARALGERIKELVAYNKVGISYDYVKFDKQFSDPWHIMSLDYSRQTRMGSVAVRVNYANRFARNGLQYEMDAYPRISRMFYSYVNVGYSENVGVFAKWRGGFSLYANLPKSFEAEAGIRYLYFSDAVTIFTAYVGKYYSNYLFGARTYITPGNKISHSYSLFTRYYYGGADDYISATVGTGISPDERPISIQLNSNYKLISFKAGMDIKHAIKRLNIISLNASIVNQEYLPGTKGNQIQVGVGFQRRF